MSRIGKMPVTVPSGVTIDLQGQQLSVKGPKGQLSLTVVPEVELVRDDGSITVNPKDESNRTHALWGLTRTLVNNMVTGVSAGFEKTLEIEGVGYRASMQGDKLVLLLGFSHPVEVVPEPGITFTVEPPAPGRDGSRAPATRTTWRRPGHGHPHAGLRPPRREASPMRDGSPPRGPPRRGQSQPPPMGWG